ncbi:alpha/beta fold hydrolase [Usitatibacter palustris]|uniref:Haloalkane dehalogenase 2 n=1 Tax=Usitatibacter palustris TaxID=2732487 RepID=A0A6M4H1P8_9PROT|nr:alpha/beta hydrolase [Usitatibacter palustris]QJR13262.1 Haloalkane dehalogenase 2 [Usitatibacter palustris]
MMGRRNFVGMMAAGVLAGACGAPGTERTALMDVASFHARRKFAPTPSGDIAYVEQGKGRVALFIHGVPLNGLHWRHVMAELHGIRRCIALDLMGLGYTRIAPGQAVSFEAQARMVREFLDALDIDQVDLIANDSGGAVAQIFAVGNAHRLRSLTLTNCDVHDNWPPEVIKPSIEAARAGTLIERYVKLIDDHPERYARFARAYADPHVLTEDVYRAYIDPLRVTSESRNNFHRYWTSFDNAQTVAIEGRLRELKVPTLIVWALDDIFFDVKWAHWLGRAIPGTVKVVGVPGAKLFFPEDRPNALLDPLWDFLWSSGLPSGPG